MPVALLSTLLFLAGFVVFGLSLYWRGVVFELWMLLSSMILGVCVVPTLIRFPLLRDHFIVDPDQFDRKRPSLPERKAAISLIFLLALGLLAGLYWMLRIENPLPYALISAMVSVWLSANLIYDR